MSFATLRLESNVKNDIYNSFNSVCKIPLIFERTETILSPRNSSCGAGARRTFEREHADSQDPRHACRTSPIRAPCVIQGAAFVLIN